MKQPLNITLDEKIIKHINNKRGLVSMSAYLNEILKVWCKKDKKLGKHI